LPARKRRSKASVYISAKGWWIEKVFKISFRTSPPSCACVFLTLGLWTVRTYSRMGSSLRQLLGRQQTDKRAQREHGKPPVPVA
jgi:hypothetical protein